MKLVPKTKYENSELISLTFHKMQKILGDMWKLNEEKYEYSNQKYFKPE